MHRIANRQFFRLFCYLELIAFCLVDNTLMYLYHIQGVPKTTSVDAGAVISTIYMTNLILCTIEVGEFVDTSTNSLILDAAKFCLFLKIVFPVNSKGLPNF